VVSHYPFEETSDGGTRGTIVTIHDSTELKKAAEELTRKNLRLNEALAALKRSQAKVLHQEKMASIGQLAAGVAHEINNPIGYVHSNLGTLQEYAGALLALIEGYATALAADDPVHSRDTVRDMRERLDFDFIAGDLPQLLSESREGIERVTKIVQDLKDFSHVGRNEAMRPADLEKGLESTLNIVWNDLKYKVRVEKHYSPLPLVECHPSEINQVLMNLLINAGQAIAERGTIVLATGAEDGEAWINISDSGCGIPDESLQRIFDPFYTTKPIGRGTGLGLAICYRIIAKHHGRIEVSSRVGAGTTFRVVLPVTQPASPAGDGT
jgi:signal transduction histidine kinase